MTTSGRVVVKVEVKVGGFEHCFPPCNGKKSFIAWLMHNS
jgi:hypothetical protein